MCQIPQFLVLPGTSTVGCAVLEIPDDTVDTVDVLWVGIVVGWVDTVDGGKVGGSVGIVLYPPTSKSYNGTISTFHILVIPIVYYLNH